MYLKYFILLSLLVHQVLSQYRYPDISDSCTLPITYYDSSYVSEVISTVPILLLEGEASGAISDTCVQTAISVLSVNCLAELYIQDGCCSTACNSAIESIYSTCFGPLVNLVCASNDATDELILFNIAKRCINEVDGATLTCSSGTLSPPPSLPPPSPPPPSPPPPSPPPPSLPPPSPSAPSPSSSYVYPTLYNTSTYSCAYGPVVYYPGVSVATIQEEANSIFGADLSACSITLLENLLNECINELTEQDGCCASTCATSLHALSDGCLVEILTAVCDSALVLYPNVANTYKRCVSGYAPVCSNGVVDISFPPTPPSPPPPKRSPPPPRKMPPPPKPSSSPVNVSVPPAPLNMTSPANMTTNTTMPKPPMTGPPMPHPPPPMKSPPSPPKSSHPPPSSPPPRSPPPAKSPSPSPPPPPSPSPAGSSLASPPPSAFVYPAFFAADGTCAYGNSTYALSSTDAQNLLTPAYSAVLASPTAKDCSFAGLVAALEGCSVDLTVQDGCCMDSCAQPFEALGSPCLIEILDVLCADGYAEGFSLTGNLYKRCIYGYAPTCTNGVASLTAPSP